MVSCFLQKVIVIVYNFYAFNNLYVISIWFYSWSEGTLYDPLGTSKTLWPVSRCQAMFLPEFQIRQVSLQNAYIFLSIIAKGAYGKVYKIQKQDTGEFFALKVISKAKVVAENGIMQAKQEVCMLLKLKAFLFSFCIVIEFIHIFNVRYQYKNWLVIIHLY